MITDGNVHIWQVFIPDCIANLTDFYRVLNAEEIQRAKRFHFVEHHDRYVVARGVLRKILNFYTKIPAEQIVFAFGAHGKPFLASNPMQLQFNVSHSQDIAVYAVTIAHEIGIDIEKITAEFTQGLPARFFSPPECQALFALPKADQAVAFYRLWAHKEAIIKVSGAGLQIPLTSFVVDLHKVKQKVEFFQQEKKYQYYLEYLALHPAYQAAFATTQTVTEVIFWQWTVAGPMPLPLQRLT